LLNSFFNYTAPPYEFSMYFITLSISYDSVIFPFPSLYFFFLSYFIT
jgi:hypothetical protein